MGTFFTNIQLKISSIDKTEAADSVIGYITTLNEAEGFVKVDNEEDADKTIVVSFGDNSDWMSIYDEEMEEQSPANLNKLPSALSKQFNTIALSVLVHDTDSLYIGLNKNGILKDSISNIAGEIDFKKNKPQVWGDILLGNYSFEDIKKAWLPQMIFVEDFLEEFAQFIGVDIPRLLTGYRYVSEEEPSEGIRLSFAQRNKKKALESGLTEFKMLAGTDLIDVMDGETQNLEWILTNQGVSSQGVDVVIAGECIDKGLLIPKTVQIAYIKTQPDQQGEFVANFEETLATSGEKIFYARNEDVYIPKGFKVIHPLTPKERERYGKAAYENALKFTINFAGGKEGTGDFVVFFSPLINRENGSFCASLMKGTLEDWLSKKGLL